MDWLIGRRFAPVESHAWVEAGSGPIGRIPQATAQTAIERDLRRATIKLGQTVMEIGTGLTGALLAELVGPDGYVASIDIDPAPTQRATTLHIERGVTHIPQSWIDQAKPWAVISTPVYVAEVGRLGPGRTDDLASKLSSQSCAVLVAGGVSGRHCHGPANSESILES